MMTYLHFFSLCTTMLLPAAVFQHFLLLCTAAGCELVVLKRDVTSAVLLTTSSFVGSR